MNVMRHEFFETRLWWWLKVIITASVLTFICCLLFSCSKRDYRVSDDCVTLYSIEQWCKDDSTVIYERRDTFTVCKPNYYAIQDTWVVERCTFYNPVNELWIPYGLKHYKSFVK